jgi:hypothetical protein
MASVHSQSLAANFLSTFSSIQPLIFFFFPLTYAKMIKAISALIALAAAATAEVVVLTPDNFDTVVDGSKPVLVEFYGASK